MSLTFPGTITGAPQTGFTSPTYTTAVDVAPDAANGKQVVVTAVGGTQAGVSVHSASSPFSLMWFRPKVLQFLRAVSGQLSLIGKVPRNTYGLTTRKGVSVLAGQPAQLYIIRTTIDVPAGADVADPANVRAALSAHFGVLWNQSAGIGDSAVSGTV